MMSADDAGAPKAMRDESRFSLRILSGILLGLLTICCTANGGSVGGPGRIKNTFFDISWAGSSVGSWRYTIRPGGHSIDLKLPVFDIDGKQMAIVLRHLVSAGSPVPLRNGTTEYVYEGPLESDRTIHLQVTFRVAADNPVLRFRYALRTSGGQTLLKRTGKDDLVYLTYPMKDYPERKEIRLSVFNEMIHSCNLSEIPLARSDFEHSATIAGPILLGSNGRNAFLSAYEHDSMYQDRFVEYRLQPDGSAALGAVKGNYCEGQSANGYSTIWLEVAGIRGGEDELAERFRQFVLKYLSENTASRRPYIYYNTWGRQERAKWSGGQYLATMNLDYTLREIDRAHEMGIDVYVLDAGWFDRTGDWGANPARFPDGFVQIREKLEGFGMQLGVWMNPEKAAVSSRALQQHGDCLKTRNGKAETPSPEWETEDSTEMCLVSPYWEDYADVLARLYHELGVRYFYLDGISQSGCDDPGHFHGSAANSVEDRGNCYGFLLPAYLGKIIEKVAAVCPNVIFDFDVTESRRIGVGLQFLASGRYFILNNGPYFHNFDLCPRGESILPNGCRNIFINPGPARTWFMRSVLDYDRWIPANLFMANYQSDGPENSQLINLASLVLGQNAVWGEILKTSPEGVGRFREVLDRYKRIRDDVALASPVHIGRPGDTPEVFEKINPQTGKGVAVIFANTTGTFSYVTKHAVANTIWHNDGVTARTGSDGHAEIVAEFGEASAKIVFFG